MQRRLFEIHLQVVFDLRVLDVPVHVDDSRRLLENLLDLRCQCNLAFVIRPVNFRHQGLQHGRPGRNLRHFDARAEGQSDLVQLGTQPPRDFVALRFAVVP